MRLTYVPLRYSRGDAVTARKEGGPKASFHETADAIWTRQKLALSAVHNGNRVSFMDCKYT